MTGAATPLILYEVNMSKKIEYLPEILVNHFTDESAILFRKQVLEYALSYPKESIRVYINSDGGELEALGMMVNTMKSVPNKFHTICVGRAYSCGALLLSFGDRRSMGKFSTAMIHEVSAGTFGSTTEMENNLKEIKRQNKVWLSAFAQNIGMDYSALEQMMKANDKEDLFFLQEMLKNWAGP